MNAEDNVYIADSSELSERASERKEKVCDSLLFELEESTCFSSFLSITRILTMWMKSDKAH